MYTSYTSRYVHNLHKEIGQPIMMLTGGVFTCKLQLDAIEYMSYANDNNNNDLLHLRITFTIKIVHNKSNVTLYNKLYYNKLT